MMVIAEIKAGGGVLGICPAPGRQGDYAGDLGIVTGWAPVLVLSMTEPQELVELGAEEFAGDLARNGIGLEALPIKDFGVPGDAVLARWPEVSKGVRAALATGGRALVHCRGGCGRSGMAVLRLMIEMGEAPEAALARLRAARPCAVETDAQKTWAFAG
ncbi:protein phosphatase [Shimia sp.]|uniref:protein phosphatase n=1 Tax=Shimia sp. TaxID=1954381 RepID=UPI0032976BA3